jgi:hypothetical protein
MLHPISLSTSLFESSLAHHILESKPDPLERRQMEGWTCQWNEEKFISSTVVQSEGEEDGFLPFQWKEDDNCQRIMGILTIQSNSSHVTVFIRVLSEWTQPKTNDSSILRLELSVRASIIHNTDDHEDCDKEKRKKTLRRKKMSESQSEVPHRPRFSGIIQRIQQDDYIQKLLQEQFNPVCQAIVRTDIDQLEERVWMDQTILEAIRRAIYPHASSTISVVELLTCFPFLSEVPILGQRAKLRLLEDAMLDVCDQEGDDELLDELSLVGPSKSAESCSPKTKKLKEM